MAPEPPGRLRPLALVASIVAVLAAFAAFVVAFLVTPLAVLVLFAIGLAAADRARRRRPRA